MGPHWDCLTGACAAYYSGLNMRLNCQVASEHNQDNPEIELEGMMSCDDASCRARPEETSVAVLENIEGVL